MRREAFEAPRSLNHDAVARTLRESVGRALFSRHYFFHRLSPECSYVYPLFSVELHESRKYGDDDFRELLYRAAHILSTFGRNDTLRYFSSIFDLPWTEYEAREGRRLEAFVGEDNFDLLRRDGQIGFAEYGRIPITSEYGVRSEVQRKVLVLGTYAPTPWDYFDELFENPISPEEKLDSGAKLTEIERVLLVCNHLLARDCEAVTGLGDDHRDVRNVFYRIRGLMNEADLIVVLLCRPSVGVAIEYGLICADPKLSQKTVTLVAKGEFLSNVANRGTFLLESPVTAAFEHESELLAILDDLVVGRPS